MTTDFRVSETDCSCKPHYYDTEKECAICDYKCGGCKKDKATN